MDCVFCAIAAGTLPAHLLHEDDDFLVLLDIFPLRPAHVLIVSLEHAPLLGDLPAASRDALLALATRVATALYATAELGVGGINFIINDGPLANQHVPHLHLLPAVAAICWRCCCAASRASCRWAANVSRRACNRKSSCCAEPCRARVESCVNCSA